MVLVFEWNSKLFSPYPKEAKQLFFLQSTSDGRYTIFLWYMNVTDIPVVAKVRIPARMAGIQSHVNTVL